MNKNQPWDILRFTGADSWDGITNHASTAPADGGLIANHPSVYFTTAAAHGLAVGSMITIDGTVNYDGTHQCVAGTTASVIYILANYVAETLGTGDTFKLTLAPKQAFEFGGFRLKLSAVGGTASENLTITVDAGALATVYDYLLYSQDMETVQYLEWDIKDNPMPFDKLDELDFAWVNLANVTYGLEVYWRRR